MYHFTFVIAAIFAASVTGSPSNCSNTYRQLVDQAAEVKRTCEEASLKDCCQYKMVAPWSSTGTYQVDDLRETASTKHAFSSGSVKHYARCGMNTDGGKWTVIQRRINGSVDFYLDWTDYVNGFGDLEGEFWYGLENMHCLTTREDVELRIELGNGTVPSIVWTYQLFKIDGADTNYRLTIGYAKGVGGTFDAMAYHNGSEFSTRDRDNDNLNSNCVKIYGGAWWNNACHYSNLNSKYVLHTPEAPGSVTPGANRLNWYDGSVHQHYTKVQMKIRPKRCRPDPPTCS